MKISLTNFRCYNSRDISTPNTGVLLLSGPSGKGKSTLLNAISYAITGEGKNINSFGTTKCSVSVEIDGIEITRTKRPNRLTVKYPDGTILEDDEAQVIINKTFGGYFNQSSYIMQGNLNTFLYMSPTEKLAFFEDFVFNHLDLSDKKNKIKDIIKERNTKLLSSRSKLDMGSQILSSKKEPEKPVFPIKSTKEERPEIKAKYERLKKNKTTRVYELETQMKRALEIQDKNRSRKEERTRLSMRKETIENELGSIRKTISETIVSNVDYTEDITTLTKDIKRLQQARDLLLSSGTIEDISDLESKRDKIKEEMWNDGSEEETQDAIDSYNQMIHDLDRYYNAKEGLEVLDPPVDLEGLRRDIQNAELCKKTLVCPCCKESLSFDGNILYKMMKLSSVSVSDLRKKLSKAESVESNRIRYNQIIEEVHATYDEIYTLDDARAGLQDYVEYMARNRKLESQLGIIEASIKNALEKNKKVEERRGTCMKIMEEYNVKEADILYVINAKQDRIAELTEITNESNRNRRTVIDLKKKEGELNDTLEDVTKRIDSISLEEGEDPQSINETLAKERADLSKIESVLQKIDVYERNLEDRAEYDRLIKDKDLYEKEVKKWEELLESIYVLKEKISIAESLYLEKTLGELNVKIQENLNLFFTEEPIVVSLETFKPTKDKKESKPQINLQVFYKGVDMDLMSLSGGERDRVNLAIVLALNSLFNSPMLLLDECISSLDYNNFNKVIDALQENMKDKLVLLVCHQAEEGQFDDVLVL